MGKGRRRPIIKAGRSTRTTVQSLTGGQYEPGHLGVFCRSYPPRQSRDHAIQSIQEVPEDNRTADQWWMLGEYQILNGLLDEDEDAINDGVVALTAGAAIPSVACLMDLGWILASKALDALALPYLTRASELVTDSRDIWSLRAVAEIGLGKREAALQSLTKAASLPGAQDADQINLDKVKSGSDLKELRRSMLMSKIGLGDPDLDRDPPEEQAKAAAYVLRILLDREPTDMGIASSLGYAWYCAGQFDRARLILETVVASRPADDTAWTILGLISKRSGDADGEITMYRRAIEANPRSGLALMNLASRIMAEQPEIARRYLETALEELGPESPHRACALDLMGNTFAHIEKDYDREAIWHREAVKLAPTNALYRDNLVLALLSAGRPIDARRVWQPTNHIASAYPFSLGDLVKGFCDETIHPYECLQINDAVSSLIGLPGQLVLLKRAWKRRAHVPTEDYFEFLCALATSFSQAGDDQAAVLAWQEATPLAAGEKKTTVRVNQAVALQRAGHVNEALELIESLPSSFDRYHTVLGNIRRDAGLNLAALDAYRIAVEKEPIFTLPFANAFDCIGELKDPALTKPFISALESRWEDGPVKKLLLMRGNLLAGRPQTAALLGFESLTSNGRVLTPEEIFPFLHDSSDDSLFVAANTEFHLAWADALLRSGQLTGLRDLVQAVFEWPRWANGDWRILNAEIALQSGALSELPELLIGMDGQIPAQVTLGLAALQMGDEATVEALAHTILGFKTASGYRHPQGRPDSLAHAMLCVVHRSRGDLQQAVSSGREAIRLDPSCVLARAALVNALVDLGEDDEFTAVLEDALRRQPSEPRILRLAVETYINAGRLDAAEGCLNAHRQGLDEFGSEDVGFRLGELVFAAKLDSSPSSQTHLETAVKAWDWIEKVDQPLRSWLAGVHHCLGNRDEMRVALAMFAGKIAERLIIDRLLLPFRIAAAGSLFGGDGRFKDVEAYLEGGRAPSLGGVVRLLRASARPFSSSDSDLLKAFRTYLRKVDWHGSALLRDSIFINRLGRLAEIRNESAHLSEPTAEATIDAISIVVESGRAGLLFKAFGLNFDLITESQ